MTAHITNKSATEADLEVRLSELLKRVLPGLSAAGIKHQTTFSIKFGKKKLIKNQSSSRARSDILLTRNGENLAIVELKREGLQLTGEDEAQGLSYARVLHPRPPIVILSNGEDTRILETATGEPLNPNDITDEHFTKLVDRAARIARTDVDKAISGLMATDPSFWASAFRLAGEIVLGEMTGSFDTESTFQNGFLIPREATTCVVKALENGHRLVVIEGVPMAGKSHVLKDLESRYQDSNEMVVFYISADHGGDILQDVADALGTALDFPVTKDEARDWLKIASNANGPIIAIAIDELTQYKKDWVKQIRDLTSSKFGDRLRVVLAADLALSDKLFTSESGRSQSSLSKRASRIEVGLLTRKEFGVATNVLKEFRIGFLKGAELSSEYRAPWVLRSVLHHAYQQDGSNDPETFAIVPAILGGNLIDAAAAQEHDPEIKAVMRDVAQVVLKEARDKGRQATLHLESMSIFIVRRSRLRNEIEREDENLLLRGGYMRRMQREGSEPLFVIRTPELLASIIADAISEEIRSCNDTATLGPNLVDLASSLPLGDIIVGHAIYKAAIQAKHIPQALIDYLINQKPERHIFEPGSKMLMLGPDGTSMKMDVLENNQLAVEVRGKTRILDHDEDEPFHQGYSNFHPWLILAHLCHHPMGITGEDGIEKNAEAGILLEIGKAGMPVRRPNQIGMADTYMTHEIEGHGSIVCHKSGIVEPVSQAIFKLLHLDDELVEAWIDAAIAESVFPLVARIHLALDMIIQSLPKEDAAFQNRMMQTKVQPAMKSFPLLH